MAKKPGFSEEPPTITEIFRRNPVSGHPPGFCHPNVKLWFVVAQLLKY